MKDKFNAIKIMDFLLMWQKGIKGSREFTEHYLIYGIGKRGFAMLTKNSLTVTHDAKWQLVATEKKL